MEHLRQSELQRGSAHLFNQPINMATAFASRCSQQIAQASGLKVWTRNATRWELHDMTLGLTLATQCKPDGIASSYRERCLALRLGSRSLPG